VLSTNGSCGVREERAITRTSFRASWQ